jgi:serine/threonine-protein kinase
MGDLFVVRDPRTGERVAAKTIRADRDGPAFAARFQVEARAWMALGDHPNVVRALFFRELEGIPFLFLEYVESTNGEDLLRGSGALPVTQALEIGAQVLAGLAHAHEARVREGAQGLVHRDLKPANLLVRPTDRRVKITDWGLVKILGATRLTSDFTMLGTLRYCAPEQTDDAASVDPRADLFAVGVFLYEAVAGVHPFPGDDAAKVARRILLEDPTPLADASPGCPEELSRLVGRLLEKRPEARPSTAREAAERLAAIRVPVEPSATCSRCGFLRRPEVAACPLCEPARPRRTDVPSPGDDWRIRARAGDSGELMVAIGGGPFRFGGSGETRSLPSFAIDRTPVTNAQFAKFVEEACYRPKDATAFLRHWTAGRCPRGLEDHPVTWVSWHDATAYAAWAGKRLPTWEEWERAARGTDGRPFPWGDAFDATRCNTREAGLGATTPVTRFALGASPDGVLDLFGNVREWTDTWREPDLRRTKVVCGASWTAPGAAGLRRVQNLFCPARDHETGFRCAREGER